ncbi:autotransporter domain-containing protein [Roseibium sp. SCP14]|uniref:DUF7933 domain-containing protein n=1 Tax=Roseibium sp. SCP14 TaxID=3141375 RepID=UPI003339DEEC
MSYESMSLPDGAHRSLRTLLTVFAAILTFGIFGAQSAMATPTLSQSFTPSTISVDGISTLIFEIDNSANVTAATSLFLTNNLPAGVLNSSPSNTSHSCGGTLTAPPGSSVISYTGGSVGAGATCTIAVDVTSSIGGSFLNISGDLTSSLGNSGNSQAVLTVEAPEIDVQTSGGASIANNGADDQGNQTLGVQQVVTYTVVNTGSTTLTLSTLGTSANDVNLDSVSGLGSGSLASGETLPITLRYTPDTLGPFSIILSVGSNDADESPYVIVISGTGVGTPEIDVTSSLSGPIADGATESLGVIAVGSRQTLTYTVENTGSSPLTLIGRSLQFTTFNIGSTNLLGTNTTLLPGETTTVGVEFTPTSAGPLDFELRFSSDDADESPYNILISGTVVAASPEIDVSSSESGAITDGGTDTVSGVADAGSGASITYTITNTGTADLNLMPVAVASNVTSTTNVTVNSFTLSSTTVASGGGSATLQVDYTPTTAGAFDFDFNLANDDADENPFNVSVIGAAASTAAGLTATSGSGQSAEVGAQFGAPLVATVTDSSNNGVSGVDVTFTAPATGASLTFASTGTNTETVTTAADGTATSSALTANSTASDFSGGSLRAYSVIASASGLTTASFSMTNGRDSEADIQKTQEVIASFVTNRANAIVNGQPDIVSRLSNGPFGRQRGQNGFDFNVTPYSQSGNFQFSYRAFLNAITGEQKSEDPLAILNGSEQTGEYASGWDFWAQGTFAVTDNDGNDSTTGLLFAGLDYRFQDRAVVGLMGQLDITDEDNDSAGTSAEGVGWMVGPYAALRVHQNFYLDGLLTYGQSDNTVNALGLFEDDFRTERFLLQGGLTGDFKLNETTRVSPFARLTYYFEEQESYTDTLGRLIPSQDFDLGRLEFGPKVSWDLQAKNMLFSPFLSVSGIYDFNKLLDDIPSDATLISSDEDLRAKLEAGAGLFIPGRGIRVSGEGYFDGFGTDDFRSYGGTLSVKIPF